MKPVLILEHQLPENAAYLKTYLENHNIPFVIYNTDVNQYFPENIEPYSALAIMGGSMSANDPIYTSRQAEILILQAIHCGIPIIGHCLGGQLISKALGGKITKSYKPEIGWQPISYTDNELTKAWFGNDPTNTVMHWHYESFSIPKNATLLASSNACQNQAFCIDKVLAMQFHIEIDSEKTVRWANDIDPVWDQAIIEYDSVQNKQQMLDGIDKHLNKHKQTADHIYSYWVSLINDKN